jgi:outer membrane lipoprotein-sorting protein
MKKHLHIIIVLIFTIIGSVNAQNSGQKILNDLADKTNSYKSIKVGFIYKMVNVSSNINEQTEGSLLVAGNKYNLKIAGQEIVSDGKTIWTYIADANEVQINEVDEEESFSPTKLLSSYSDDYTAELEKEINENGRALYLLKLKPKVKNSGFDYVHLKIDKAKLQVVAFILYDFEKNVFSYLIKEYLTDVALDAKAFSFDTTKYKGVDIIDMR